MISHPAMSVGQSSAGEERHEYRLPLATVTVDGVACGRLRCRPGKSSSKRPVWYTDSWKGEALFLMDGDRVRSLIVSQTPHLIMIRLLCSIAKSTAT